MVHDFTRLPAGHVLPDGRRIERCPLCGRNGVLDDEATTHFEYEPTITADGEVQVPQPRRNAVCRRTTQMH